MPAVLDFVLVTMGSGLVVVIARFVRGSARAYGAGQLAARARALREEAENKAVRAEKVADLAMGQTSQALEAARAIERVEERTSRIEEQAAHIEAKVSDLTSLIVYAAEITPLTWDEPAALPPVPAPPPAAGDGGDDDGYPGKYERYLP